MNWTNEYAEDNPASPHPADDHLRMTVHTIPDRYWGGFLHGGLTIGVLCVAAFGVFLRLSGWAL